MPGLPYALHNITSVWAHLAPAMRKSMAAASADLALLAALTWSSMRAGAGAVGQDYLRPRVADVLVLDERRFSTWFAGPRRSHPLRLRPWGGFRSSLPLGALKTFAILLVPTTEEQSCDAGSSTGRQVEPAQGHERRLRGGWRQSSAHGEKRAPMRAALSDSSQPPYGRPSDGRTPFVL